jgi:Tol biopolymer transport system component
VLLITVTNTPFVLFTVGGSAQADLYRAPFDGSTEPIKLSITPTRGGNLPGFVGSPDGHYVAYLEGVDDGALFVVESSGGGSTLIAPKAFTGFAFLGWSPDSTRIGYIFQEDPDVFLWDIFSSAPDGTENIKLSVGGGRTFKWSPDSSRIAYGGAQGLIGITRDGSESVRLNSELVTGGRLEFHSWSPDSTRIAYAAEQETVEVAELFTAALDGGQNLKLNAPIESGSIDRFAWSPDGSRIGYIIRRGGGEPEELRTVVADGSDDVKLSERLPFSSDFAWSPDSRRIAYRADDPTDLLVDFLELFSIAADGSERIRLSGELVLLGDVRGFAWSPDGSRIAYVADQDVDEVFELYTSAADGSDNVKASGALTTGGDVGDFAWSPHGSRIVYIADQEVDDFRKIYSVAPDGSDNVSLTGLLLLEPVQQLRVD